MSMLPPLKIAHSSNSSKSEKRYPPVLDSIDFSENTGVRISGQSQFTAATTSTAAIAPPPSSFALGMVREYPIPPETIIPVIPEPTPVSLPIPQVPVQEQPIKKEANEIECVQKTRTNALGVRNAKSLSNEIETSKYNLITFIPKNLIVQLSKLAHMYFIIIGICQLFREISTTNGTPAVFLPLLLITMISMVKDFLEDRQRHAADKKENESQVLKLNLNSNKFEKVNWSVLHAGDIVKVEENHPFPADILILQTPAFNGDLLVETKNLDGETNLKRKKGVSPISFAEEKSICSENLFNYALKYELPNPQMYSINGVLNYSVGYVKQSFPVSIDNICLRGSNLKLTQFMVGMVVYAGHETKILLNSENSRVKKSRIETLLNKLILWIFILLLVVCTFSSSYYSIWFKKMQKQLGYIQFNSNSFETAPVKSFFLVIPLWILLLGHFVPISLMVTLEMVKYFQGKLLQYDKNYANINDDEFVDVKSCNLIEDLGCINYVFSDKTGTLTVNEMNFKALSLNGVAYSAQKDQIHDETVFNSQEITKMLTQQKPQSLSKEISKENEGFNCLNLCHTIQVLEKNGGLVFCGVSPDEESIMQFCYKSGCYFAGENIQHISTIKNVHSQQEYQYKRIATLDFDFVRRKMSVIVQDLVSLEYKLYCKGADQSIFDICVESGEILRTNQHLHEFATLGLRTLAFAYKPLTEDQVSKFLKKLESIQQSVLDKDKELFCLYSEIEQGLTLLGGTGIHDRLQTDVEKTLTSLKTAGIKIWMLTGDKIETATNIACQCQLISLEATNLFLDSETTPTDRLVAQIEEFYLNALYGQKYSVIITGHTIYKIEHMNELHSSTKKTSQTCEQPISLLEKLHEVLFHSETVIASKITPKQKADMVQIVKKRDPKVTTLAIGDGANDVSMIATAHVGIGIRGKEGRQAAKVSDFSIGEFRHLNRLLLYQGYETYRKNSQLVFFNFYKNQIGFLVYFWYNFMCGQNGTFIYDQWVKQLYNLIFTALPIILYCLFDELYPAHQHFQIRQTKPNQLESMPLAYKNLLANPTFTAVNFWKQFFKGSLQSIIVTIVCLMGVVENAHSNGRQLSHLDMGMLIFTLAVIIPNIRVFQLHTTHYPFTVFFIFGSIGVFFISLQISSKIRLLDSFGVMSSLFSCWNSYFCIALVLFIIFGAEAANNIWKSFTKITIVAPLTQVQIIMPTNPSLRKDQNSNISPEKKSLNLQNIPEVEPPRSLQEQSPLQKSIMQCQNNLRVNPAFA